MNDSRNITGNLLIDFNIDDYIGGELAKLTILKEFVRVSYYKTHCVFRIHRKIYDYLLSYIHRRIDGKDGKKDERIVDLYSILIYFANPRTLIVSSMTESDMAKMVGVSVRTIRRYLKNHENSLYKILPANNHESFSKVKAGMGDTILPNDYMRLIDHVFAGLKNCPRLSARDSWKEIRIEYKGLDKEKFFDYYYKKYKTINSNNRTYIGGQICLQNIDKQINKCEKFVHFNNPIYEPGFNVENTPYPCNWCLHPDEKAYFVKGRWYHGAIHGTKRGRHREGYLEYKGLTHEIDMHNAMFYFMVPLLPDSILGKERTAYCETVKAGTLYDDLIEDMCEKLKEELADNENGLMPSNAIDAHDFLPDRDTVKRDFQVYRNLKGKRKNKVRDVAVFMDEKFPTIHEWMLGNMEVMQNRLAWIETDFISYVGEKLSAENIRFDWLHDAVYVSEADGTKAQEIWDSVRKEFEAAFM